MKVKKPGEAAIKKPLHRATGMANIMRTREGIKAGQVDLRFLHRHGVLRRATRSAASSLDFRLRRRDDVLEMMRTR